METHDGVDVNHDAHQHDHVAYARYGTHQSRHNEPEILDRRDQAHNAEQTRQPGDHRELPGGRYQGEDDNQKVKDVPPVAEIPQHARPQRQHLEHGFDDEHRKRDLVP